MLSGAGYVVNDILDSERDRVHPSKRKRPIASGRLGIHAAWSFAALLALAGTSASFVLDPGFGCVSVFYLAITLAYSTVLKQIVLLDVLTVAAGFVLRAAAGAAVIGVAISPWLFICTILIALFISLAKRRDELECLQGKAADHRSSLAEYSVPFLDQLINITASSTIMAYALYTFFSQTGTEHPYLMATLPFVIYGIFRYILLVHNGKGTGSPELLIISDRPLLADIILWAAACAVIVAMPGRF
jgi:4-hydroxybenzoate polyprenyltransferase